VSELMTVAEAMEHVFAAFGDDAAFVCANGYVSRDAFAIDDRPGSFYMLGSMGLTASIALGAALARPQKRVVVLACDTGNKYINKMFSDFWMIEQGFIEREPFDQVGCFPYSDEEGTTAAKMPNKVDDALIADRHDRFMRRMAELHHARLERWLGRELEVLVDEQRDCGCYACRHYGQASEVDNLTLVESELLEVGARVPVRVTGREGYDLVAEVAA